MESIWLDQTKMPAFHSLNEVVKTDVAIVGGGIAGILTAYMLKQRGVDCVILEKDRICQGTTGHTTGKITAGQGLIYGKIMRRYGREIAQGFYIANDDAIRSFQRISKGRDCNFETRDNYVYSICSRQKIEDEVKILNRIGARAEFYEKTELPFSVAGAVFLPNQAQFNPLMLLGSLAEELEIYENTFVRDVQEGYLICDTGGVKAKNVVIATHFPFINSSGFYFLKLYQHRSYVLALEGAQELSGMYVDEAEGGLSFRNYGNVLMLGGGGHRTGKGGGCYSSVREAKERYYKDSVEKYAFAAQDCMSLDGMPYIGSYSTSRINTFVATGFNKWGMCGAMISACLLADKITGRQNDLFHIFSPRRSLLHHQLLLNAGESLMGLLYPTVRRCSHLGCALHWNRAEHSWDCACHGSRFDPKGRIIDNPSQKDARL